MIKIKIPSKTFLVGEYVALNEGPALLLNTGPEFCYTITDSVTDENSFTPHANSPTGIFFLENSELFSKYSFEFNDPHREQGGFGASGAQFNGLVALKTIIDKKPLFNSMAFREKLLFYSKSKQSGYDVISQFNGKICHVNISDKTIERLEWPFPEMAVTIIRTGNNVKTHEHLKNVKLNNLTTLEQIGLNTVNSFKGADLSNFTEGISQYYAELINLNLICEESRSLVAKIKSETTCFHAVKACGAAGADTVLAIHAVKDTKKVKRYFNSNNLEVIFSGNKFSEGMHVEMDPAFEVKGQL